jgi:hypothetical protein
VVVCWPPVRGARFDREAIPDMDDSLSNEPEHKLHVVVFLVNSYVESPLPLAYRTACGHWYFTLTEQEKVVAIQAAQAFNSGDRERALQTVAALPPVPRL